MLVGQGCMTDLVVKDNALIQASYTLGLVEQRLILLAMIEAREEGQGVTHETFLDIHAGHYAKQFNVTLQSAYQSLSDAVETLYQRQVTLHKTYKNKPERQKVRWVSGISYVDDLAVVRIRFSPDVIPLITRLEEQFTSYELEQVAGLQSAYAVRLYELLIQWRTIGKTPVFDLVEFRQQLGVSTDEYLRMGHFKERVLDLAITQINEKTDITASYEQHKTGRTITGFSFKFKTKKTNVLAKPAKMPPFELTDEFVAKHAQVGESWQQARLRLSNEAKTGKFSLSPTN
jgi:plasmid replication initiation protein